MYTYVEFIGYFKLVMSVIIRLFVAGTPTGETQEKRFPSHVIEPHSLTVGELNTLRSESTDAQWRPPPLRSRRGAA
jgi:hypothetical protein